jgi:flavodoxin
MNIGMIVYSQTGNTWSVAQELQKKLSAAGHTVTMERIEVISEVSPGQPVQFSATPEPQPYDALVLGSPVQAFSLCQAMVEYLKQVAPLQGKKVACLITQAFPFPWLGGNRAVRQMTRLCKAAGADVCGSGIVNWMKKEREQQIVDVTDNMSTLF